jgi:hypothetical protein
VGIGSFDHVRHDGIVPSAPEADQREARLFAPGLLVEIDGIFRHG